MSPLSFWLLPALLFSACSTAQITTLSHFPTSKELATPASAVSAYRHAALDFERAKAAKLPKYARFEESLRDGGTTFYRGEGYSITCWNKLSTTSNRTTFVYAGPQIFFEKPISPRGLVTYSVATTPPHP